MPATAGASFGNMGNWASGLEFVAVLAGLSLVIQPVVTSLTTRFLAARWPGRFRAVSWLALSGINGLGLLAGAMAAGAIGMAGSAVGVGLLIAGYRSVLQTSWLWAGVFVAAAILTIGAVGFMLTLAAEQAGWGWAKG